MWKEIILAAVGATGFGILFGVQRKRLWIGFLASGTAWYGYLVCAGLTGRENLDIIRRILGLPKVFARLTGKENLALFLITMLVMLSAKLAALYVKEPVLLFTTPVLIPFIPGATLYYVIRDLLSQAPSFWENLELLAGQVGAMVLGIICVFGISVRRQ